jgi:hypothetical protein
MDDVLHLITEIMLVLVEYHQVYIHHPSSFLFFGGQFYFIFNVSDWFINGDGILKFDWINYFIMYYFYNILLSLYDIYYIIFHILMLDIITNHK